MIILAHGSWLMTPTVHAKTKTKAECNKRPSICYIFGKQGVQLYQISHSDQSNGQLFVGQLDQTRTSISRPNSRACILVSHASSYSLPQQTNTHTGCIYLDFSPLCVVNALWQPGQWRPTHLILYGVCWPPFFHPAQLWPLPPVPPPPSPVYDMAHQMCQEADPKTVQKKCCWTVGFNG